MRSKATNFLVAGVEGSMIYYLGKGCMGRLGRSNEDVTYRATSEVSEHKLSV